MASNLPNHGIGQSQPSEIHAREQAEKQGQSIGANVIRREGREKTTGEARYLDDYPSTGVWVGGTIRTTLPACKVNAINFDPSFDWKSVAVVTAKDIPGPNCIPLLIEDQPALVDGISRHPDEPVVLIAAPDKETLGHALKACTLDCEELPAIHDLDDSLNCKVKLHGDDNVFKRITIKRGDAASAMQSAAHVLEGEYTFGAQEQLYIEPQGMQAVWSDAGVHLIGSMQCPYYVVKGIAKLLGLEPAQVRVQQSTTGGGFGGKEDYPSVIAAHAALLARKSAHPVRLTYDRVEDIRATPKRHPGRVRIKSGFDQNAKLVALEIDCVLDGGAYCTLSPVVLSRGAIHAGGPYDCPNTEILARAVATNSPPHGAFRGFGAPQTIYAIETHMDVCAKKLGVDGIDLRRRNLVRANGVLCTGQNVGDDAWAEEALDTALQRSRFYEKREAYAAMNRIASSSTEKENFKRRGIGLALFHHGAGFTGIGEVRLASIVSIRGNSDGTVTLLCSQTEIGQGTRTILAQTAADGLGIPVEWVLTEDPDTKDAPNSGPTVASRTAMVVGGLFYTCGQMLRAEVEKRVGRSLATADVLRVAIAEIAAKEELKVSHQYKQPSDMHWDEDTYQGDAYAAYGWACYVAEVEVDTLTGEVKLLDFTAVQEVGRVINPIFAYGQIEGGVAQGLGWAILENVVYKDGRVQNPTMTDYIVPTSKDTPKIDVIFLEHPHHRAPHGAKGIGELPMDGPAPAVVNALRDALGVSFTHIPVIPEIILPALEGAE